MYRTLPLVLILAACSDAIDAPKATITLINEGTLAAGDIVQLDGSTSKDPNKLDLQYRWSFVAAPADSQVAYNSDSLSVVSFVPDEYGDYTIGLIVSNGVHTSPMATAVVTVDPCGNEVPVIDKVDAAPAAPITDQIVQLSAKVSDADSGCGRDQVIDWAWRITSRPAGSQASLNDDTSLNPSFTADVPGDYQVELIVTDETGRVSEPQTISITASECANAAPTLAEATVSPTDPIIGDLVTLALVASDADNSSDCELGQDLTVSSSFIDLPVGSSASFNAAGVGLNPAFTADLEGAYTVRSTVTDSTGRSTTLDTSITVDACGGNTPTISDATATPATPNTGEVVTVAITAADADNDIGTCGLSQTLTLSSLLVDRPPMSQAVATPDLGAMPSFVADVPGDYTLRTWVTDDTGRAAYTDTSVTVSDCGDAVPTVASVLATPTGANTGDTITFAVLVDDNDNSSCALGQTLTVSSSLVDAPAASTAQATPALGLSPAILADVPGDYTLRTVVKDGTGRSSFAETTISISDCGNATPKVVGTNPSTLTPNTGESVSFAISVDDTDNSSCGLDQIVQTSSKLVERPALSQAVATPELGLTPGFVADVPGTYTLRTWVTDDTGRVSSMDTTVVASDCGNGIPQVTGVTPSSFTPNSSDPVTFVITVDDTDNSICTLDQLLHTRSELVDRPALSVAVATPDQGMTPGFIADLPGSYTLRTTVTDDTGRSSFVDTTIVASDCGGGIPQVVSTAPSNTTPNTGDGVSFAITLADTDNSACNLGQTLQASSVLVDSPSLSSAIATPSLGLTPGFVADLPGSYTLRTTVTDGTGRSSFLDTTIVASDCGFAIPEVVSAVPSNATPNTGDSVRFAITLADTDNSACGMGQTLQASSIIVERPPLSTAQATPGLGLTPGFVADLPGSYTLRTTVTDGTGRSSFIDTTVVAADCGSSTPTIGSITPSSATPAVNETVVVDIVWDDADISSCGLSQAVAVKSWFVQSPAGSSASLLPSVGDHIAFLADQPGVYVIRTSVTDDTGRSVWQDTTITADATCGNQAPVALLEVTSPFGAGPEQNLTPPDLVGNGTWVQLDARASFDPDLDPTGCNQPGGISYQWSFLSMPVGSTSLINNIRIHNPSFQADKPGLFELQLMVDDGTGLQDYATVAITVVPASIASLSPGYTMAFIDGNTALWNRPEGLTVDDNGNVVVVQTNAGWITTTDPTVGATSILSAGGELSNPRLSDIAWYAGTNRFYATLDNGNSNSRILEIDLSGAQARATQNGELRQPRGLTFFTDAGGNDIMLVMDRNWQGTQWFDATNPGTGNAAIWSDWNWGGNLNNPGFVTAQSFGGIDYVYASDDSIDELWRADYSPRTYDMLATGFNRMRGIETSSNSGDIVVADEKNGILWLVRDCGGPPCSMSSIVVGNWRPWGVAFDPNDPSVLYVTDRNSDSLYQIIGPF